MTDRTKTQELQNAHEAEQALREFEVEARFRDRADLAQRMEASGAQARCEIATELVVLAMLIIAAIWLAVAISGDMTRH